MRNVFVLLIIPALMGCGPKVSHVKYTPPQNSQLVNVKFVAIDGYRHEERLALSVVSRRSCKDKIDVAQVTAVETRGYMGKDSFYKANAKLPANELLHLQITNWSKSDDIAVNCSMLKGIKFRPNKSYVVKVNNWSTKTSRHGGFGCHFKVYEVSASGKGKTPLEPLKTRLPRCK